jgi:hypothetical protein
MCRLLAYPEIIPGAQRIASKQVLGTVEEEIYIANDQLPED